MYERMCHTYSKKYFITSMQSGFKPCVKKTTSMYNATQYNKHAQCNPVQITSYSSVSVAHEN